MQEDNKVNINKETETKDNNIKANNKEIKPANKIEKIIYVFMIFMLILIGVAVFILFKDSNTSTQQSSQTSLASESNSNYKGSEIYILTLGELTEQEIEELENTYKCDVVLTEDITNNKSYKLVFKKYISTDKITNIKEELKENGKIILVTIPANSI